MKRIISFLLLVLVGGWMVWRGSLGETGRVGGEEYMPEVVASEFASEITNNYFTLPVGRKFIYEEMTDEGLERNEIVIEEDTREIMGVMTRVYHDLVYLDGVILEDTRDFLAQDVEGNVWYFGEEVDNYEEGKLADHDGSWMAGVDGAKPGIWLKAEAVVGDSYRQEYLPGEAEDMTEVAVVDQTVQIVLGTYDGCVKMYDWTPLEATLREYKYYCPEVGGLVLVENIETGGRAELVEADRL